MRIAVNGKTPNAQLKARRNFRQRRLRTLAAGQAVSDNPDMVAAIGLSIGKIQNVANDSANRRAHRVQDTKRLF
jgi:hypothetical protein